MRLLLAVFVLSMLPQYSSQSSWLSYIFGRWQAVAVSGRLLCNGVPAGTYIEVKLYDEEVFSDTELGKNHADYNGHFYVSGYKSEVSSIDPYVSIYHRCKNIGPCLKELSYVIPSEFIVRGKTPGEAYDLGTIDLDREEGQSTVCHDHAH